MLTRLRSTGTSVGAWLCGTSPAAELAMARVARRLFPAPPRPATPLELVAAAMLEQSRAIQAAFGITAKAYADAFEDFGRRAGLRR